MKMNVLGMQKQHMYPNPIYTFFKIERLKEYNRPQLFFTRKVEMVSVHGLTSIT